MIVFPNCKINLGLNITGKRDDGYHNLATVFIPLNFYDVVEIIKGDETGKAIGFSGSGVPLAVDMESNLCTKAYQLLKKDYAELPNIKLHLHKIIQSGAGLGGGSADGAFTLILLNTKFKLGLSTEQLAEYALKLGSDCPFFI